MQKAPNQNPQKKGPANSEPQVQNHESVIAGKSTRKYGIARKHNKYFQITNHPVERPVATLPVLHLPTQESYLEMKRDHYNHQIRVKRYMAQVQDIPYQGLPEYQYLGNLFNLMLSVSRLVQADMDWKNKHLSFHGSQQFDPNQPYQLDTSIPALANNIGKDVRTARRLIRRAAVVGFLQTSEEHPNGTVYTGYKCGTGLLINPEWLLTFDLSQPDREAIGTLGKQTVLCGFPQFLRTKCPGNAHFKGSIINNSTKAERNSCKSTHEFNMTPPKVGEKEQKSSNDKRTARSWKTPAEPEQGIFSKEPLFYRQEKKTSPAGGGAAKITETSPKKAVAADDPVEVAIDHYCQRLVKYAVRTYYKHEEIYPGARKNLYRLLKRDFFVKQRSPKDVEKRAEHIKTVIDEATRHVDAKPDHRFALMPNLFFDLGRPSPQGNYSGFVGIEKLLREREQMDLKKTLRHQKKKRDRNFRAVIKRWEQSTQTPARVQKFVKYIQSEYAEYVPALETYFTTGKLPQKL